MAHLLRRCHEMIEEQPAWARETPRQVRDLLLEALDARDLDADARAKAVADIGERFDLLIEAAHPHDANRRLIKHLRHERGALFSSSPSTASMQPTGEPSRASARPSSIARSGAATDQTRGPRPRAGS